MNRTPKTVTINALRSLGRAAIVALLAGSVFSGIPAAAAASDVAQPCPFGATAMANGLFAGLAATLGDVAGTPAGCASVDATGNVIEARSTGLFVYNAEQDLSLFTNGAEDWTWGPDGVTFYAYPGAPGALVADGDLYPGAPRVAPPAAAAPAPEAPVPAPAAPAPAAPVDTTVAPAGMGAIGGTYVGLVQTRQKLTIQVSPDGRQITSIDAQLWCTDMSNTSRTETITFAPAGPFPIGPDGRAAFSELTERLDSVAYTHFLDATFNGSQVTGTLKIKSFVSGAAYACNTSDLPFSATLQ